MGSSKLQMRMRVVGFALAALIANPASATPADFCDSSQEFVFQYLKMQIEGKVIPLLVPKRYLEDRHDHVVGATHGAQLFRMDVQSFEPVTRKESGDRLREGRRGHFRLLLSDVIEVPRILQSRLLDFSIFDFEGPLTEFEAAGAKHGLQIVTGQFAPLQGDLFFLGAAPEPELVIYCRTNPTYAVRSCTMHYEYGDLDVQVTFDRPLLAEWTRLKAGVDRFLDCIGSV